MTVQESGWARAKEIFHEARDLSPDVRPEYTRSACGGDDGLRTKVDALLAADQDAGAFLAAPTLGGANTADRFAADEVRARLQHAVAGRYSIENELGRGGMGVVFLARDVALDRLVAIKLLPPELSAVSEHRTRFLREARTAAGLSHPNIVPIHLVEEQADLVYFVMAYVDGESLSQRVQRAGPLKAADAAKLVQEVAWALAYAHGRGVIHRDIKPDNVLIEKGSGRALVSDFGIARVVSAGTLSMQGEIMGTLRYMSPEQATGQNDIDGRSDLYSLGVTAFLALTGRLPFESANPSALLAMHMAHPAPPVRSVNPALPASLAEAVDRCLAKDPAARFATGEALASAIADAQVTRREIAPSVREFLTAAKNGAVQFGCLTVLWFGVFEALPRLMPRGTMIGHPLDPVFAMLGTLTLLAFFLPLHAARGVVRAGLDERDVADAVGSASIARDANVEYELARNDRLVRWLRNPVARAALLSLSAALGWIVFQVLLQLLGAPSAQLMNSSLKIAMALVLPIQIVCTLFLGSLAIAPRRVVALLSPTTPENASVMRRLWTGPVGRWLFKIAGIGLRRGNAAAGSSSGSAPTEVLLGRAAGALFDQLPVDQRQRLGDVHDVIRGLERAAMTLRSRQDDLSRVAADVGVAGDSPRRARVLEDLETARAPLEQRMQAAVSALEKLRLDLLRLRAGLGHPDDLTAAIEEARSVRLAVEVELSAVAAVESLTARSADR